MAFCMLYLMTHVLCVKSDELCCVVFLMNGVLYVVLDESCGSVVCDERCVS